MRNSSSNIHQTVLSDQHRFFCSILYLVKNSKMTSMFKISLKKLKTTHFITMGFKNFQIISVRSEKVKGNIVIINKNIYSLSLIN